MTEIFKKISILAGILLVSILAGSFLLMLVYAIPVDRMEENVIKCRDIFSWEGSYPQLVSGYKTTQLDNYTDALMLSGAISSGSGNIVKDAMNVNHMEFNDMTPTDSLLYYIDHAEEEKINLEVSYPRYWHGYLIILKPLLNFFDLADIRILNMICQGICILMIAVLLTERNLKKIVLSFGMSVLLINPIVTSLSLQNASVFYIALFSLIFLLIPPKIFKSEDIGFNYIIYFLLIGILTPYFDLLTYPFVTLGLPLTLFFVLHGNKECWKKQVSMVILFSASWAIGYLGMWGGKLLIGSLITGANLFQNAFGEAKYLANLNPDMNQGSSILEGISRSIRIIYKSPYVLAFFAAMAYYLFDGWKKKRYYFNFDSAAPYLLILFLPLVHMLASTHIYYHYWFTYRELSITVFAMYCLLATSLTERRQKVGAL